MRLLPFVLPVLTLLAPACAALGSDVPDEPPPLVSMQEPTALLREPDDEDSRAALPLGGYTGIHVTDGRTSLGSIGAAPAGVLVQKVVENSPGDAAGVREGDLIVSVQRGDEEAEQAIHWPSEWRAQELAAGPGDVLKLVVDRAAMHAETSVTVAARVRRPERDKAQRFREEQRVGVVVRTATEVEARAAELAPGGGAVIVGLAAESPWRDAGLRFGDLIVAVDGTRLAHPQVLLDALREAPPRGTLTLRVRRRGRTRTVQAPLSSREQTVRKVAVPLLLDYGAERGESELSILFGLVKRTSTAAAWEWRILWFIKFGGGDSDRLEDLR